MKSTYLLRHALLMTLLTAAPAFAQAADAKPKRPADPAARQALRAARPGAAMRGGLMPAQTDPFIQAVAALGDLNLSPDFTLTSDQKQKLAAIRGEAKKAQDKWMADHEEEIRKLQEEAMAARQANDQAKMREVLTLRQEMMANMPKTDASLKQLKETLTDDQRTKLEEKLAERKDAVGPRAAGRPQRPGQRPRNGQ